MRPCCALLLASAAECVSVDRHGARGAQVRSCHLRPCMSFAEPATSRFALRDELLSLLPPGAPTALNVEHDALVEELERLKNTPATPAFLALGLSGLWSLRGVSAETLPPHPMASDAAGHPWAADGGGRADAAGADGGADGGADDGADGGAGGGEDGGADADGGARADAAGSPTLPETRAGSAPAEKAAENFRLELGGVTVDFDSSEGEEFVVSSRAHFSLPDETPGGEKNHVEKKNELIMNDSAIVADDDAGERLAGTLELSSSFEISPLEAATCILRASDCRLILPRAPAVPIELMMEALHARLTPEFALSEGRRLELTTTYLDERMRICRAITPKGTKHTAVYVR